MRLTNFDSAAFLRDTWQRQPLVIRNPWLSWTNPIDPDELAGLACEDEVEARMITRDQLNGDRAWDAEHGPFAAARFDKLGKVPWTLLVQAADQHVPQVAALLEPFRFIPNWRIDDVMVSYASNGGGVGPHFDHYDVFLIQGLGQRRWQVGQRCDATTPLLPHDNLRLLAHFQPTDEWLLEPGDMLYVPPGFAHNGVAVGDDCMTYSIGFRAPSRSELISHWCDDLLAGLDDDDRYADPALAAQANPGEIAPEAIARLHAMVTEKLSDQAAFARWFGGYSSTPKYPELDWRPEEAMASAEMRLYLAAGTPLIRNPASRFSFIRQGAGALLLFADGECFECAGENAALAELMCAQDRFHIDDLLAQSDAAIELVAALYNQGNVAFEAED